MIIKKFKIILINFLILFFTLLIIDNLILFCSAKLPWYLVKTLSLKSQYNYKIKNENESFYKFQEYIYTLKANQKIPHMSDGKKVEYTSDENGYLNPPEYLKNSMELEFLLVGDSYTAYPEYSEYLRNFTNQSVYSIGMGGQGLIHWQYQLKRFNSINKKKLSPKNIIFNFYENDLDDTLRAKKYYDRGYTHSIYYPTNGYSDNLEKIDRKISLFHEFYSIIRYIIITSKIRKKIDKLFFKNPDNLIDQYSLLLSDGECRIQFQNPFLNSKDYFSASNKKIFTNSINSALQNIDLNKTKVYFVYIPSSNVIYSQKYKNNSMFKNAYSTHKKIDKFFKDFFKISKKKVTYINFTDILIEIGVKKNLHPCNGKDSHFSHRGFEIFVKNLINKLN
jgi:hypothetical protein